eukprot:m.105342 g.105342  ORF g.105342 m.105342 type:complete len:62 (+) comp16866_c0_seq1:419-604(+)
MRLTDKTNNACLLFNRTSSCRSVSGHMLWVSGFQLSKLECTRLFVIDVFKERLQGMPAAPR